ncbi:hypothetical protein [Lentiprolixibacter aurantiacus]|uniref:Uncharacterized protein n=1 Tax=Lentiprolixibacter aurantiacus TaxID=2993939 RepID=A0AAE3MLR7_9FLAO|nr:hypothetical protein [Lentiprolixibacter aurantiacus]MCX2719779.1 hypothetical protein [Lentiprolixibacter aurantiacus]
MANFKIKWNSERILSMSAMSISFITLVIFIYQTNLMSKQNYLSILPYLQISTSNNTAEGTFSVDISNHGVGPAIIESVKSEMQGEFLDLKEYHDYFWELLVSQDSILDSLKSVSTSTLNKGIAIPANTTYNIFKVNFTEEDRPKILRLIELLERIPYEIRYKSIQNEHWVINETSEGPQKLD